MIIEKNEDSSISSIVAVSNCHSLLTDGKS